MEAGLDNCCFLIHCQVCHLLWKLLKGADYRFGIKMLQFLSVI